MDFYVFPQGGNLGYIHERKVLNILIKGKQIRDGRKQDVYLHVLHPKWKAYHLIGIGLRGINTSIEESSRLALENILGLLPHQYELDPLIKIDNVEEVFISGSLGTLTKYIISVRTIKQVKVELNLRKKIMDDSKLDQNSFRWFTLKDINRGYGNQGEPIMHSSPLIFKRVDTDSIPISVSHVEDFHKSPRLMDVINSRFTRFQQFTLIFIIILSLITAFSPQLILSLFKMPDDQLQYYANYSQMIGTIFSIVSFLIVIIKGSQR